MEIVQTVYGDPPERAHHLSLPQLLLPASPLAAALISGNKNGRKFSICSWQQILSLQAPAPPPHPISYSICSSCPTLEPPSHRASRYQGQSSSFVMISFMAIVFNPYRTNRWVKKQTASPLAKTFLKLFISREMHDRWREWCRGTRSGAKFPTVLSDVSTLCSIH